MKYLFYAALCSIFLVSCNVIRVDSDNFTYIEGVTFQIKYVKDQRVLEEGNVTKIPEKGFRYKGVDLKFQNNTNKDQIIDFEDFYLLDENNNKYRVRHAVQNLRLTSTMNQKRFKLRAGSSRLYLLTFIPPFPVDQEFSRILVKDQVITF